LSVEMLDYYLFCVCASCLSVVVVFCQSYSVYTHCTTFVVNKRIHYITLHYPILQESWSYH